jgi:NAD(P)-dependent dehydrogenase (short-subunit alcohol dehydrogenase family)
VTVTVAFRSLPPDAVVLVTGATDGIGRAAAMALAQRGARLVLHGRSPQRAVSVEREVQRVRRDSVVATVLADFGSLAEVRAMAREIEARVERVDVLVNNAGVYMNQREASSDGFEMTFAVNHLAPFLLTHLLLGGASGGSLSRVVTVASNAHKSGNIALDDLRVERQGFSPLRAYGTSKLANILFSLELARRVRSRGILVNCLHPGVITTKLLTEGFGMRGFDTLGGAADTITRLSLDAADRVGTGGYFYDGHPAEPDALACDERLARAFYEESARMVGVPPLPMAAAQRVPSR